MSRPVAVLAADIHYNLQNLTLSDAAMRMAIHKANALNVPLIVAGDLHDTKANLRGECINAMIKTFEMADIMPWIIVGNHDKIHEKSLDNSLGFLAPYAHIIDEPLYLSSADILGGAYLIPYQHDTDVLKQYLSSAPKKILIMHQGLQSSNMGDYIQDKSAITKEDVSGFRVISGHYHARQTIALPDSGKWDFIGSPFTMTYGEANDPPKGFQILMSDGSLEFVPTNLRKHVVINVTAVAVTKGYPTSILQEDDLNWIKVSGTKEELSLITRDKLKKAYNLENFRLDLIPTDTATQAPVAKLSQSEMLDSLINSLTNTSEERKSRLLELWRSLYEHF